MTSSDPETFEPVPVPEHPDPARHRALSGLRAAAGGLFRGYPTADIRRSAGHEETVMPGAHVDTRTAPDPVTGEPIEVTSHSLPIMPILLRKETHLFGPEGEGEEHSPNLHHPLFEGLRTSIAGGDFRSALRSHREMQSLVRRSLDTRVSKTRRVANHLSPEDSRRENYVQAMYSGLNHATYQEVMAVPNMLPDGTDTEGHPRFVEDTRNWSAELDLYNVQALRAQIMGSWQTSRSSLDQAHAMLESGGLYNLGGLDLANYLGVDHADLRNQIKNHGPVVVPPQVLAKLNFFISYADDVTPESGLSTRLAELNDVPGPDIRPAERMHESVDEAARFHADHDSASWRGHEAGVYENPVAMAAFREERAAEKAAVAKEAEIIHITYLTNVGLSKIDDAIERNIAAYLRTLPPRDSSLTDDEILDLDDAEAREKIKIRRQTVAEILAADFPDGAPKGLDKQIMEGLRQRDERLEKLRRSHRTRRTDRPETEGEPEDDERHGARADASSRSGRDRRRATRPEGTPKVVREVDQKAVDELLRRLGAFTMLERPSSPYPDIDARIGQLRAAGVPESKLKGTILKELVREDTGDVNKLSTRGADRFKYVSGLFGKPEKD